MFLDSDSVHEDWIYHHIKRYSLGHSVFDMLFSVVTTI